MKNDTNFNLGVALVHYKPIILIHNISIAGSDKNNICKLSVCTKRTSINEEHNKHQYNEIYRKCFSLSF